MPPCVSCGHWVQPASAPPDPASASDLELSHEHSHAEGECAVAELDPQTAAHLDGSSVEPDDTLWTVLRDMGMLVPDSGPMASHDDA